MTETRRDFIKLFTVSLATLAVAPDLIAMALERAAMMDGPIMPFVMIRKTDGISPLITSGLPKVFISRDGKAAVERAAVVLNNGIYGARLSSADTDGSLLALMASHDDALTTYVTWELGKPQ